jgi:nucleoside-diphosphate-sugar epimerase
MTVVLFGGSGFIGRHLTRWLAARDDSPVLIADIEPPPLPLPDNVSFEPCDVRQPINLDVPERPTVYNLAAVHRSPGHADHEFFDTNVSGARNVVDFCVRSQAAALIFTSSIAVYGPTDQLTTEASPARPSTAYGSSKLEAEQIQIEWAEQEPDRSLVIVRPAAIFGPGERGNFTRLASAIERHRFAYPGTRDTLKACGYVTDLVESLAFAQPLAQPVVTYNFAFPEPPTTEEVCRALAQVGGFSPPRVVIPMRALLLAARALSALGASNYHAERVVKLVDSTRVVPDLLVRHGYPYRFDLRGAFADWYASAPPASSSERDRDSAPSEARAARGDRPRLAGWDVRRRAGRRRAARAVLADRRHLHVPCGSRKADPEAARRDQAGVEARSAAGHARDGVLGRALALAAAADAALFRVA